MPLKIRLDEGVHEIAGFDFRKMMNVTCSHIIFVGKGKDQTTIRGGFQVVNQQHVKFEELTIITHGGVGLWLEGSETNVDVLKCAVQENKYAAMFVHEGATVTATQCEFMENSQYGVYCDSANTKARLNDCKMHHNGNLGLVAYDGLVACGDAVVDLHGTKTDIHSNKNYGIRASSGGKVNIHLPSQHNTSHDNAWDNREQDDGGSIVNINADGTFTHVEEVHDDDDHDY